MFEKRRLRQLSFDFTWEICHLLDITAVAGGILHGLQFYSNEPPSDKTNKMACAPSEDSDQSDQSLAVRMKTAWVLSYPLSAKGKLWSDWADAQADLSSLGAHAILLVLSCGGSNFRMIAPIFFWCANFWIYTVDCLWNTSSDYNVLLQFERVTKEFTVMKNFPTVKMNLAPEKVGDGGTESHLNRNLNVSAQSRRKRMTVQVCMRYLSYAICKRQWRRSSCTSAQSDQLLYYWLSHKTEGLVKALVKPSLFNTVARVRFLVTSCDKIEAACPTLLVSSEYSSFFGP